MTVERYSALELATLAATVYPTFAVMGHKGTIAAREAVKAAANLLEEADAFLSAPASTELAESTRNPLVQPQPDGESWHPGQNPSHQPPRSTSP